MLMNPNVVLTPVPNNSVEYKGPKIVDEFTIGSITWETFVKDKRSFFTFSIHLDRLPHSHLNTIFYKTAQIWLLAYLTLHINIRNFNNRFMGSLTAFLAMTFLVGTINGNLPKTSYLKYIDIWVTWHITLVIIIIVLHVIVDMAMQREEKIARKLKYKEAWDVGKVQIYNKKEGSCNYIEQINKAAIIILPGLTFSFWIMYFIRST